MLEPLQPGRLLQPGVSVASEKMAVAAVAAAAVVGCRRRFTEWGRRLSLSLHRVGLERMYIHKK